MIQPLATLVLGGNGKTGRKVETAAAGTWNA